jgi:hypothetical protein
MASTLVAITFVIVVISKSLMGLGFERNPSTRRRLRRLDRSADANGGYRRKKRLSAQDSLLGDGQTDHSWLARRSTRRHASQRCLFAAWAGDAVIARMMFFATRCCERDRQRSNDDLNCGYQHQQATP